MDNRDYNENPVPSAGFMAFIKASAKTLGLPSSGLRVRSITGDGSTRRFWRVETERSVYPQSLIVLENEPSDVFSVRENRAYLRIGMHLFKKGLPVPKILRHHLEKGWFILEDLGDVNLQRAVQHGQDKQSLYQRVLSILLRLQLEGAVGFDPAWCCQTPTYDQNLMRRYESDYFREAFLKGYQGIREDLSFLDKPFNQLAESAATAECRFFLHRDFQSRNIMIVNDRLGVLDWQGARLGPLGYDLASLLIDPYVDLGDRDRNMLYQYYMDRLASLDRNLIEPLDKCFPYLAVQRNLQILGAFAYLSNVKKKTHFVAYIPPALESLQRLLHQLNEPRFRPLESLIMSLNDRPVE